MLELQKLAQYAAQHRIRGRSYKRNSLLKPLDFMLDELERCPNEVALARASSKGLIEDHVRRIARGVPQNVIYEYVDLFFSGVLDQAHQGNANKLLQRERSLRSAYLVYMREALAELFVKRGKASNAATAFQEMDQEDEEENNADAEI